MHMFVQFHTFQDIVVCVDDGGVQCVNVCVKVTYSHQYVCMCVYRPTAAAQLIGFSTQQWRFLFVSLSADTRVGEEH